MAFGVGLGRGLSAIARGTLAGQQQRRDREVADAWKQWEVERQNEALARQEADRVQAQNNWQANYDLQRGQMDAQNARYDAAVRDKQEEKAANEEKYRTFFTWLTRTYPDMDFPYGITWDDAKGMIADRDVNAREDKLRKERETALGKVTAPITTTTNTATTGAFGLPGLRAPSYAPTLAAPTMRTDVSSRPPTSDEMRGRLIDSGLSPLDIQRVESALAPPVVDKPSDVRYDLVDYRLPNGQVVRVTRDVAEALTKRDTDPMLPYRQQNLNASTDLKRAQKENANALTRLKLTTEPARISALLKRADAAVTRSIGSPRRGDSGGRDTSLSALDKARISALKWEIGALKSEADEYRKLEPTQLTPEEKTRIGEISVGISQKMAELNELLKNDVVPAPKIEKPAAKTMSVAPQITSFTEGLPSLLDKARIRTIKDGYIADGKARGFKGADLETYVQARYNATYGQ